MLKHTDHYALHLVLNKIPMKNKNFIPSIKYTIWNTKKKESWNRYKDMTNEDNKKLKRISEGRIEDPNTMNRILKKEITNIKHTCFGKIKVNTKSANKKTRRNFQAKR